MSSIMLQSPSTRLGSQPKRMAQQATHNRGGPATCSARARVVDVEAEQRLELEALLQRSLHQQKHQQPQQSSRERSHPKRGSSSRTAGNRSQRSDELDSSILQSDGPPGPALSRLQPNGSDLLWLLGDLVKFGKSQRALQVLDWVLSQPQFEETWPQFCARTIDLLDKQGSGARHALELHRRLRRQIIPLDLVFYNTMISSLGKARKWQQVMDVYAEMQECGVQPDVITYSSLIKACQSCGNRWMQAMDFLEEMKAAGVRPNIVTYTTLVSCCQRAGRWRQAMAAFREMEEAGLQADVKAYNSLISACAKGGRWEHAWEILAGMRRGGMRPTARSYNALLSACDRARQPQRALEAYRRMLRDADGGKRDQQPTLITYNTLISACAKEGLLDDMEQLLTEMDVRGLTPDAFTLSALINGCRHSDRWERALELVEKFEARHGVRLNTVACNALIATLGRARRWQYALQFFERLEAGELDGKPDSWTYAATVMALRAGGQHARVWALYARMRSAGLPIYKDVYHAALEACERLGMWKEGRQVLRDIEGDPSARRVLDSGLDAAWHAVFAFPPLMESVPQPIISAARAAVDSGKLARRFVSSKRDRGGGDEEDE